MNLFFWQYKMNIVRCCKPNSVVTSIAGVLLGIIGGYSIYASKTGVIITNYQHSLGHSNLFGKGTPSEVGKPTLSNPFNMIEFNPTEALSGLLEYITKIAVIPTGALYVFIPLVNAITGITNVFIISSYLIRLARYLYSLGADTPVDLRVIRDISDIDRQEIRESNLPNDKKEENIKKINDLAKDIEKTISNNRKLRDNLDKFIDKFNQLSGVSPGTLGKAGFIVRPPQVIYEEPILIRERDGGVVGVIRDTPEMIRRERTRNEPIIKERELALQKINEEFGKQKVLTSSDEKLQIRKAYTERDSARFTVQRNVLSALIRMPQFERYRNIMADLIVDIDKLPPIQLNLTTEGILNRRTIEISLNKKLNRIFNDILPEIVKSVDNFNERVTNIGNDTFQELHQLSLALVQNYNPNANMLMFCHICNSYNRYIELLQVATEDQEEPRDIVLKRLADIRNIATAPYNSPEQSNANLREALKKLIILYEILNPINNPAPEVNDEDIW